MARLSHKPGSALDSHKWKTHDKGRDPCTGVSDYNHSKLLYQKRKEMQALQKLINEQLKQERQQKRDAIAAKQKRDQEKKEKMLQQGVKVDERKIKHLTRKQYAKSGYIKV